MPIPVLMPALSPTMEHGKLAKWLKKEGDKVAPGDAIAEIETDKATMEVEAVDEGVLGKILIPEGSEGVAVNTPIAILLGEGEDASEIRGAPLPSPQPSPYGRGSPGAPAEKIAPLQTSPREGGNIRIFASPLARRLAAEAGLDLAAVRGTGPHGRIVKHDIGEALRGGAAVAAKPAALPAPMNALRPAAETIADAQILALYEPGSFTVRPLDNMRKTIAQRLTQAAAIPQFQLGIDCEMDALLAARERLNARLANEAAGAAKLSVNDFLIKALALALQRVPDANATFTEGGILLHKSSDVGVAVAIEGGLFTPVIRGAEAKTLAQISAEAKALAERARRRRLLPHEYQGGTTSISNLGMFGIGNFGAIINPPHATILAVGRAAERAIAKDGKIALATMMSCTLTCDHRVVDGALGARLLAAFQGFVEDPVTMLL